MGPNNPSLVVSCPCWNQRHYKHETIVPAGTEAGAPPIDFHVTFVPAAGGGPIVSNGYFHPWAALAARTIQ